MGYAHIQTTARHLHHRAQHSDAALLADAFLVAAPAPPIPHTSLEPRPGKPD
jgi:hypothetical protein